MDHNIVELSTSSLSQIGQMVEPRNIDRLLTFATSMMGAAIGAGATIWATIKTLRASVEAQKEEFEYERAVRIRSTWKGVYAELNQAATFIKSKDSAPGWGSLIQLPTHYLNEMHPYLSLLPEDLQIGLRDLIIGISIHNDLIELARNQDRDQQTNIGNQVNARRRDLLLKLDAVVVRLEQCSEKTIGVLLRSPTSDVGLRPPA